MKGDIIMNVLKFFLWLFLSLTSIDFVLGQEQGASDLNVESTHLTVEQEFNGFLNDLPTIVRSQSSQEASEGSVPRGSIDQSIRNNMINSVANKVWNISDSQYNRLVIDALHAYIDPSILDPDPSVHFPIKKVLIDFFMVLGNKYEEEKLAETMRWGHTFANSAYLTFAVHGLVKVFFAMRLRGVIKLGGGKFKNFIPTRFHEYLLLLGVPTAVTVGRELYHSFINGPRMNSLILMDHTFRTEMRYLSTTACAFLSQEVQKHANFYSDPNNSRAIANLQESYEKLDNMYKLMNENLPRFHTTQEFISDALNQSMQEELARLDPDLDQEDIQEIKLQLYLSIQDQKSQIRDFSEQHLGLQQFPNGVPSICRKSNGNMGITKEHLDEIKNYLSSFQGSSILQQTSPNL